MNSASGINKVGCSLDSHAMTLQGALSFETILDIYPRGCAVLKRCPALQLDLAGVTFCNSAALALLIAWSRDAKRLHKPIQLSNVPKKLIDMASISGLENVWIS